MGTLELKICKQKATASYSGYDHFKFPFAVSN